MIFEGFCSGSFESYQLYLSLWLINYCKIELGKAFCYQLYSDPTRGLTHCPASECEGNRRLHRLLPTKPEIGTVETALVALIGKVVDLRRHAGSCYQRYLRLATTLRSAP